MTKLHHYDRIGTARFITFCCYHRYQLLQDDRCKEIFLRHLKATLIDYDIKIYGYVIMPEHVHLVLFPPFDLKLGIIIGQIKGRSSRDLLSHIANLGLFPIKKLQIIRDECKRFVFWQRRCYDHNCRSTDTMIEKINYCYNNPVVKGLVKSAGDWIYSSYNWYLGNKNIPIEIDEY